jgi:excisionase family DNA binding protein
MKNYFKNGKGGAKVAQPPTEKRVFTLNDMADMFSVSLRTIYNWIDQCRFGYIKIGSKTYVTEKQLEEFLTNHQVNAVRTWRAQL